MVVTNKRGAAPERFLPQVHIEGSPVPHVDTLKILGLTFHHTGSPVPTLRKLHAQITQISHLLRRVTHRRAGLLETHLLRIIDAFIMSRILYTIPYLRLTCTQLSALEAALRKLYRLAIGVPPYAPTARLLDLGVFNTLEERIATHRQAQLERLKTSRQGRAILTSLNYSTTHLPPIPPSRPLGRPFPRFGLNLYPAT